MESVIWAFKQLYDKGWVYEGFRVLPYCWNDETPLSNHELRMDDDVYQNRQDPAVTVGFRLTTDGPLGRAAAGLDDDARGRCRATSRSWSARTSTTSSVEPTRPGPRERYLLAEARLPAYARELGDDARRSSGAAPAPTSLGRTYTPPFSYYLGHENAFRVVRRRRVRHHHRRHRAGAQRRRLR